MGWFSGSGAAGGFAVAGAFGDMNVLFAEDGWTGGLVERDWSRGTAGAGARLYPPPGNRSTTTTTACDVSMRGFPREYQEKRKGRPASRCRRWVSEGEVPRQRLIAS